MSIMHKCNQCSKKMTVVDWIINPVCLSCCKKNHEKAVGK